MRLKPSNRSLLLAALFVVLLASAFAAWLLKSAFIDPDGLDYYREGKGDAIAELRAGRLSIKDDQTDTLKDRIYKEYLQRDHGLTRDTLNVDTTPVRLADYIRGYNEVMAPAINEHLGQTTLDQLERQVDDELEQRTQNAEYDVYSAVLDEIEQDTATVLVIGDQTWDRLSNLEPEFRSRFELRGMVEDWTFPPFAPLSPSRVEAIDDYQAKNKTRSLLKERFDLRSKVLLLSEVAVATVFKGADNPTDGWKNFYRKYPTSPGYIRLSRVGFNRRMTEALIYLERGCGSLCADGRFKILVKEGNRWRIEKSIQFYAS